MFFFVLQRRNTKWSCTWGNLDDGNLEGITNFHIVMKIFDIIEVFIMFKKSMPYFYTVFRGGGLCKMTAYDHKREGVWRVPKSCHVILEQPFVCVTVLQKYQSDCSPACKPDQSYQDRLEAAMSTTALPNFIIIIIIKS